MPPCHAAVCRFAAAATTAFGLASFGVGTGPAAAQAVLVPNSVPVSVPVSVPWAQSAWVKSHAATTRLVAGARGTGAARAVLGGVEIKLNDGWKTYWRHPGDAGGVPPSFDWSGSTNLGSARVLYPAPDRLADANGVSIGYKKAVVFPVEITPADPTRPVLLKLQFEYGICREICVPAEAQLEVAVPPDVAALPPDLALALDRVPHTDARRAPSDPSLNSASAVLTGAAPSLTFDIAIGSAGVAAELFVEATDGVYLPVAQKVGQPTAGVQRFRIDLKGIDEIAALKGRTLLLTVATHAGGAETSWVVK